MSRLFALLDSLPNRSLISPKRGEDPSDVGDTNSVTNRYWVSGVPYMIHFSITLLANLCLLRTTICPYSFEKIALRSASCPFVNYNELCPFTVKFLEPVTRYQGLDRSDSGIRKACCYVCKTLFDLDRKIWIHLLYPLTSLSSQFDTVHDD